MLLKSKVPLVAVVPLMLLLFLLFFRANADLPEISSQQEVPNLGIIELVSQVKSELEALEQQTRDRKEEFLLELKDFDLEINFIVRANIKNKVGVQYQVVTANMEREFGQERVQTIRLHMTPRPPVKSRSSASESPITGDADSIVILGPQKTTKGEKQ